MDYIKPIRNTVMGLTVAGLGLVGSGAVLNEINKNQKQETDGERIINMLQESINSTPEGRQLEKDMADFRKAQKQMEKETARMNARMIRDSKTDQEINSALDNANNDLERTAIKAYALVRTTNNKANDQLEDLFDSIVE